MQKKAWYYEKWVGRHASFPPRQSVKNDINNPSHLTEFFQVSSLRNSSSVPSQPIQQLYDEMYMDPSSPAVTLNNSRRYSYPNSPVSTKAPSSTETPHRPK